MKIRTQVTTCVACPFPVGIHGKRCTNCQERMCLACSRRAAICLGLCPTCESVYDAETIARHEENERGRMILLDRLERAP